MMDWNLARAFSATADAGSLSAAARKLGLTQPTLSRQVAELEAALGVALFERIGKRLRLTAVGESLLEHARAMANAADALALAAAGTSRAIEGRVTISATDGLAAYMLPEIIEHLRIVVPEVTLVVVASNALSDLRRREADIAIRHVRPTEPELIGQWIRDSKAHFYATPDWIARHGEPGSIDALASADLVGFEPVERFVAQLATVGMPLPERTFSIVSENAVFLWECVRRGLGAGIMLEDIAERMPGIVRLLPDRPGIPVPIWLVTHRELRTSLRVRLVFDAVVAELRRMAAPPAG